MFFLSLLYNKKKKKQKISIFKYRGKSRAKSRKKKWNEGEMSETTSTCQQSFHSSTLSRWRVLYFFFVSNLCRPWGQFTPPPSPYRNRNKKNIERQTDNSPVSNNNFFFFLIFNAQVNFIYYIEEQEEGDIGWEGKGIFLTMDVCVCVVERCDEIIIVKNIIIFFFS